ncbi:MAG: succinylglutamate desuccinylase/aspartoacylase family protein [Synechococcales cyanobacterium K44_A2020_017]|nr:succinylglutamate desuccinylase/aspartoacylase family protein [Synechococcales cyanobacterium K32_A2020_035]MBF2096533.1 succinylglutamate desuccinylase/aspartoacylase family protein [Synechococcales cyanobacterium K44_A2020_017]
MVPEIKTVPLLQLASGDRLSLQVYRYVGRYPGKKIYIQANLHGAELAGNAVIHEVLAGLQTLDDADLRGEIWLVPLCNPLGVNQRSHHFATGRYNPYDGRDWNRIFWDYEKQVDRSCLQQFAQTHLKASLATLQSAYRHTIHQQFLADQQQQAQGGGAPIHHRYRNCLQSLALDADTVIDLHSSSNDGLTYLYYGGDRHLGAALFGLDLAIQLDRYDGDAFDEAFIKPWLALERELEILGRSLRFDLEAYTLELGSAMQMQPDSVERGVQGIQAYLYEKQVITQRWTTPLPLATPQLYRASDIQRYYAPTGGIVRSRVSLGDRVAQGQVLCEILQVPKGGDDYPQLMEMRAMQAGLVLDRGINQAVNEGEYVLALLLESSTESR